MRLLISSIAFLLITQLSFAQEEDLTGTWEGDGGNSDYAMICIVKYNNTYVGFTYDEGMGYCKCHFLGEYDPQTKKLKGVNKGVIKKTLLHVQSRYNLNYVVVRGKEYLKGTVAPKAALFGIPSPATYTRVSKKVDTTDYMRNWLLENAIQSPPDIAKHDKPVNAPVTTIDSIKTDPPVAITPEPAKPVTPPPAPIPTTEEKIISDKNKRTNDTLSVINTNATELIIKVLDNGIIDGDTVSIIHNGRVIAERITVKTSPHEIKIPIDNKHARQEIILVAHNLGSIPPNTALILIETPEKQYRLTASTDLSKNAMIIFQYRE